MREELNFSTPTFRRQGIHDTKFARAMRCFKGDGGAPQRDLYQETIGEINAKVDAAPKVLAAEQKFDPQYTALNLRNTHDALFGVNGAPGYLDIADEATPRVAGIQSAALALSRKADINDVATLGPAALAAVQKADPRTAGLVEGLTDQANQDLTLGGTLSPEQLRQITNNRMGISSARGWGFNPGDMAKTAMETTDYSQDLLNKRRQFAAGVIGTRQTVYGDQFNRVLNRQPSTNTGSTISAANGIGSFGQPSFASTINANDVYSSNQNAAAANAAAKSQQDDSLLGAGIGAVGNLFKFI